MVANGGKVVNSKKAADFYVLDDRAASYEENFKEYSERPYDFKQNVRAIDHIWIRDSATYGKRFDLQSYHAKDRSNERKQMERRLARRKPRGFTERDKDVLAKFLLAEEHRCKRENERMYWVRRRVQPTRSQLTKIFADGQRPLRQAGRERQYPHGAELEGAFQAQGWSHA